MKAMDIKTLSAKDLSRDALAMNIAALTRDYEEARFRAQLIRNEALAMKEATVTATAGSACHDLGP